MVAEWKPGVSWSVSIALIGIMGGLLTALFFDLGAKIKDVHSHMYEIRKSISKVELDLAVMHGNRFTSKDGLDVWKEVAILQSSIAELSMLLDNLPPKITQQQIDANSMNIAEIKRVLGLTNNIDVKIGR